MTVSKNWFKYIPDASSKFFRELFWYKAQSPNDNFWERRICAAYWGVVRIICFYI
jgi:hypothetical protein